MWKVFHLNVTIELHFFFRLVYRLQLMNEALPESAPNIPVLASPYSSAASHFLQVVGPLYCRVFTQHLPIAVSTR